ncbi:9641_t:CDS:2 [Paraglomus occultum]|uniref:9641_t:CDS:1 n=1 Tax=Paraglomus occultum TaxID=144539 RepID=A0A9N8W4G6_9GLOM|nr:9641_t:CDS:2 [Paraglomus occultum]
MFESIINEYLESEACKNWSIIAILEYIKSKSRITADMIEVVKEEIYSALQIFRDTHNVHVHVNAKNKARRILASFEKSFASVDVKLFIHELELHNERREFHLTVCRNVTSSNTLQALEQHRSTRKAIEEVCNTNVDTAISSVDDESYQYQVIEEENRLQENIHKRSFTEYETNNLHPFYDESEFNINIILTMEKYCKKQTTSKFDLAHNYILDLTPKSKIERYFEPEIWAKLIADRPATAKPEYYKEIEFICDHLFGPPSKKKRWKLNKYRERWASLRNLEIPDYDDDAPYERGDWERILYWAERAVGSFLNAFESEHNPIQQNDCGEREWFGGYIVPIFEGALTLNSICRVPWGEVTVIATIRRKNHDKNALEHQVERGHLADFVCKINQQEVVCGLACGGPHKYDHTKWESDEYHLPRMLKDTLDDMLENCRSRNRRASNLYTIGIQQYMTEIRIYMMEKRDVYRFHLLKSFNLPLSHALFSNLRFALSWAWNIKGLVERLSFELEDGMIVSSRTPERDPPDEMKTNTTPERSKKKKV